jgi:hypothetical protein
MNSKDEAMYKLILFILGYYISVNIPNFIYYLKDVIRKLRKNA